MRSVCVERGVRVGAGSWAELPAAAVGCARLLGVRGAASLVRLARRTFCKNLKMRFCARESERGVSGRAHGENSGEGRERTMGCVMIF